MGKGEIVSEDEDGKYRIKIKFRRDRYDAELEYLKQRITEEWEKYQLMDPGVEKQKQLAIWTAMDSRREFLETNFPEDEERDVWCADYTLNIAPGTTVGTIEIPGELKDVLIRPGHEDAYTFEPTRDGQLNPILNITPSVSFLCWGLLPGWQKWMPTYRFGEVRAIDYENDKCTVELEDTYSDPVYAQYLDINQSSYLYNVPIEYMSCNAAIFEEDDAVLVEFEDQEWENPKVIGFKQNPKPCDIYIKIESVNGFEGYKKSGSYVFLSQPKTQEMIDWRGIWYEDFTIIREKDTISNYLVEVDANGVACMARADMDEVDNEYGFHAWFANDDLFKYMTTDYKGTWPRYLCKHRRADTWTDLRLESEYRTDEWLDWADSKVDPVSGIQHSTALESMTKQEFQTAEGETVKGYVIAIDDVYQIKRYYERSRSGPTHLWALPEEQDNISGFISDVTGIWASDDYYTLGAYGPVDRYHFPTNKGYLCPSQISIGGLIYNQYSYSSDYDVEYSAPYIKSDRYGRNPEFPYLSDPDDPHHYGRTIIAKYGTPVDHKATVNWEMYISWELKYALPADLT